MSATESGNSVTTMDTDADEAKEKATTSEDSSSTVKATSTTTVPQVVVNLPQKKRIVKVFDIDAFKAKGLHSLVADRLKALKTEHQTKSKSQIRPAKAPPAAKPQPESSKNDKTKQPKTPKTPKEPKTPKISPTAIAKPVKKTPSPKLTSDSESLQLVKRIMNEKLKNKLSTSPLAITPPRIDDFRGFSPSEVEREYSRSRRISECIDNALIANETPKIPSYTTLRTYLKDARSGESSRQSTFDISMEEETDNVGETEHTLYLNVVNRDLENGKVEIEVMESNGLEPTYITETPPKLDIKVKPKRTKPLEVLTQVSGSDLLFPAEALPSIISEIVEKDTLVSYIPSKTMQTSVEPPEMCDIPTKTIPTPSPTKVIPAAVSSPAETTPPEEKETSPTAVESVEAEKEPEKEEDAVDFLFNCFFGGETSLPAVPVDISVDTNVDFSDCSDDDSEGYTSIHEDAVEVYEEDSTSMQDGNSIVKEDICMNEATIEVQNEDTSIEEVNSTSNDTNSTPFEGQIENICTEEANSTSIDTTSTPFEGQIEDICTEEANSTSNEGIYTNDTNSTPFEAQSNDICTEEGQSYTKSEDICMEEANSNSNKVLNEDNSTEDVNSPVFELINEEDKNPLQLSNKPIVLENKILSQEEKVDLKSLLVLTPPFEHGETVKAVGISPRGYITKPLVAVESEAIPETPVSSSGRVRRPLKVKPILRRSLKNLKPKAVEEKKVDEEPKEDVPMEEGLGDEAAPDYASIKSVLEESVKVEMKEDEKVVPGEEKPQVLETVPEKPIEMVEETPKPRNRRVKVKPVINKSVKDRNDKKATFPIESEGAEATEEVAHQESCQIVEESERSGSCELKDGHNEKINVEEVAQELQPEPESVKVEVEEEKKEVVEESVINKVEEVKRETIEVAEETPKPRNRRAKVKPVIKLSFKGRKDKRKEIPTDSECVEAEKAVVTSEESSKSVVGESCEIKDDQKCIEIEEIDANNEPSTEKDKTNVQNDGKTDDIGSNDIQNVGKGTAIPQKDVVNESKSTETTFDDTKVEEKPFTDESNVEKLDNSPKRTSTRKILKGKVNLVKRTKPLKAENTEKVEKEEVKENISETPIEETASTSRSKDALQLSQSEQATEKVEDVLSGTEIESEFKNSTVPDTNVELDTKRTRRSLKKSAKSKTNKKSEEIVEEKVSENAEISPHLPTSYTEPVLVEANLPPSILRQPSEEEFLGFDVSPVEKDKPKVSKAKTVTTKASPKGQKTISDFFGSPKAAVQNGVDKKESVVKGNDTPVAEKSAHNTRKRKLDEVKATPPAKRANTTPLEKRRSRISVEKAIEPSTSHTEQLKSQTVELKVSKRGSRKSLVPTEDGVSDSQSGVDIISQSVERKSQRRRSQKASGSEQASSPRRSKPTNSELSEEDDDDERIPLKKRFRRKRQRVLDSDSEMEPPPTTPINRKPLRQACLSFEKCDTPQLPSPSVFSSPGESLSTAKKRGRKPIKETVETALHPRLLLVTNRAHLSEPGAAEIMKKEILEGEVQCGFCKDVVAKGKWKAHLFEHYGIGWKQGETPVNVTSRNTVLQVLVQYFKKKIVASMACRMCQKSFKSALGILCHLENCGISEAEKQQMRVVCEHCKHSYTRLTWLTHAKSCSVLWEKNFQKRLTQEAEERQAIANETQLSNTGRVKRVSTIKAELKFKEETNIEFDPNEFLRCATLPRGGTWLKWKTSIRKKGFASCLADSCTFKAAALDDVKKHVEGCPLLATAGFKCVKCKFADNDPQVVREHIMAKHCPASADFVASESDAVIESESSEEDASTGVSEESAGFSATDSDASSNVKKAKKPQKSYAEDEKYKKLLDPHRAPNISKYTAKWTADFQSLNYAKDPLFTSALSKFEFCEIPVSEYSPLTKVSMKFSYSTSKDFNQLVGKSKPETDWMQMEQFERRHFNEDEFAFTGGPVKSLSWIPIDSPSNTQYLAVTCRKDLNHFTRQQNPKTHRTLIIIYEVDLPTSTSSILYGIAIENGPVHHMDFLPSGGFSPKLNRLGLMAVASVEHDVMVYSLPMSITNDCDRKPNLDRAFALLRVEPVMVLTLSLKEDDQNAADYQTQCLKVVWSKGKGHNLIAGGFANGCVGIWDVDEDEDNLNRFEHVFTPVTYFSSSEKHITGLDFHYDSSGTRWLCTATANRVFKVFDLADLSHPVLLTHDVAFGMMMAAEWPIVWENPCYSISEYFLANTACLTAVSPMGILFKSRRAARSICGINDFSFNTYMNVCSFGSENGDMAICIFREMNLAVDSKSAYDCKMMSATDIVRLDGGGIAKRFGGIDADNFEAFETDYKEKYGLVFGGLNYYNKIKHSFVVATERQPPVNLCHFVRINQTKFNPNFDARKLLAFGYENGFIRIMKFSEEKYTKNS